MVTSSGRESAFILRIIWPRCALTVISLMPSSPPTCLSDRPETTNAITSRSRGVSDALGRGRDRNVCADANVSGCQPAALIAQSHDHIGCAVGVANRSPRRLARAGEVWRISGQHPQTRAGVVELLKCLTAVFDEWVVDEVDVTRRCQSNDETRNAAQDRACIEVTCASCGFCPLVLHGKFLLQRVIGFRQLSRPFRDDVVELFADSLLFAHGALLTAYRRQPAFLSKVPNSRRPELVVHPSWHLDAYRMRQAADHRP
jgi:hypothetical protein